MIIKKMVIHLEKKKHQSGHIIQLKAHSWKTLRWREKNA